MNGFEKNTIIDSDVLDKKIEEVKEFQKDGNYYYGANEAAIRGLIPNMDSNCGYDIEVIK